ncbi:VOC family protein [Neorhizobium vignae]|jgi:catechol 2,3-dioxygenase-like lactoylglutathione lyase family enzyme|uniref:VOC family protein n=1 Tax=Neorhizobium vignae TaxID=690585 RepID=UPI00068AC094|nr:VOC family protein [Neorhizobium vignae]
MSATPIAILGDGKDLLQICFVTHKLEESADWFSQLTGLPLPPVSYAADPDKAQAVYHGRPARIGCRIMMFHFAHIDLEFIEPGPEPSAWRDLLERKGPGFHHLAFKTRNLTRDTAALEGAGHAMLQRGEFQSGTGRYAYFDTERGPLGGLIELLEFDRDKQHEN